MPSENELADMRVRVAWHYGIKPVDLTERELVKLDQTIQRQQNEVIDLIVKEAAMSTSGNTRSGRLEGKMTEPIRIEINCLANRFGDEPSIIEMFNSSTGEKDCVQKVSQNVGQIADDVAKLVASKRGAIVRVLVSFDAIGAVVLENLRSRGIDAMAMSKLQEEKMRTAYGQPAKWKPWKKLEGRDGPEEMQEVSLANAPFIIRCPKSEIPRSEQLQNLADAINAGQTIMAPLSWEITPMPETAAKVLLELPDEELAKYGLQRKPSATALKQIWQTDTDLSAEGLATHRHRGVLRCKISAQVHSHLPTLPEGFRRTSITCHEVIEVFVTDEQMPVNKPIDPESDDPKPDHVV